MSAQKGVPLYFISGFLGSGKTTLLNRVLEQAAGKKVGVIINEWGQENVDSAILTADDIELKELNNGQVFCSCLSGDFILALEKFSKLELDAVIVETSGLANPAPINKILGDLGQRTANHYDCRGMTVLVDPDSFNDLVGAITAVDEQIMAANRVIINKIDLADKDELENARQEIRKLNGTAPIIETTYALVPDFFESQPQTAQGGPLMKMPSKAAASPRPDCYLIKTGSSLPLAGVRQFFEAVLPQAYRMKGIFLAPDGKWYHADGVNSQIDIQPLECKAEESRLVIIPRKNYTIEEDVKGLWKKLFGDDFVMKCKNA